MSPLFSALALAVAASSSATARVAPEPIPAPVAVDTIRPIRFQIPAQPLPAALRHFARETGLRVQVDLRAAAGLQSQPVEGSFSAAAALRHLVSGTSMNVRFVDDETVLVSTAESGTYALSPITVTGARSRGYAATRSTSATRTETALRDVPQSVSVITHEAIADQAMQGMADVIRYVPGVTMALGEGHRDAPTIRGNASTADFFVDGVRDDAQYLRDLYNAERVEALKGANALVFGRGGGGGVLNRVTKEPQWAPVRAFTAEGGSYDHWRGTLDVGQGVGPAAAVRLNGVYENTGGFRDQTELRRYGVNPTLALAVGDRTSIRLGYEYFNDRRTVDRGIPSFEGRPSEAPIRTFFGDPSLSYGTLEAHSAGLTVDHALSGTVNVRNRTRFADYDKFYQNIYPGALNADGTQVSLSGYNSSIGRRNMFNQTEVTVGLRTGSVEHTLLIGAEVGLQETDNFRSTGYFNNTATSLSVPFSSPTSSTPVTFRQSASDADNRTEAAATSFFAQDQVALSRYLQAVLGLRYDRFSVDFRNNRNDQELAREDEMISPRGGLVIKPIEAASIYGSYSVSYLPSAGDQFSSLSATTETLEPEQFTNYEVGAKWDVRPGLTLAAAAYQLDRTNTSAPDPADPARTVQTGSQRTTGFELNATGQLTSAWQLVGGLSLQNAEITSTTSAAPEGRKVPLVPAQSYSLWSRYQLHPRVGVGLGLVHRSEMYAAIDNAVTLPGFTRADGAVFFRFGPRMTAQVNVENLLDERYYNTSHGNNNIMPGAPRTVRLSVSTRR